MELRNSRNWTALDCAAGNGWEKVCLKLLEAGAKMQSSGKIRVSFNTFSTFNQKFHIFSNFSKIFFLN